MFPIFQQGIVQPWENLEGIRKNRRTILGTRTETITDIHPLENLDFEVRKIECIFRNIRKVDFESDQHLHFSSEI